MKIDTNLNWEEMKIHLQWGRYRPLYDRQFTEAKRSLWSRGYNRIDKAKKDLFIKDFDNWIHSSKLNAISGLEKFPVRSIMNGCTHFIDDLHIRYRNNIVILDKEYSYHRRLNPNVRLFNVEDIKATDVLVLSNPFPWFGGEHPKTKEVLDICYKLGIRVCIDSAWYGCMRGFNFDYSHPAIKEVGFSLSKGLGLGDNRIGIRYSRTESSHSAISVINNFEMDIEAAIITGAHFIKSFDIDFLQNRYSQAYKYICEKMNLRPTGAIHMAFGVNSEGIEAPVGIRPLLRYLVDDVKEF